MAKPADLVDEQVHGLRRAVAGSGGVEGGKPLAWPRAQGAAEQDEFGDRAGSQRLEHGRGPLAALLGTGGAELAVQLRDLMAEFGVVGGQFANALVEPEAERAGTLALFGGASEHLLKL